MVARVHPTSLSHGEQFRPKRLVDLEFTQRSRRFLVASICSAFSMEVAPTALTALAIHVSISCFDLPTRTTISSIVLPRKSQRRHAFSSGESIPGLLLSAESGDNSANLWKSPSSLKTVTANSYLELQKLLSGTLNASEIGTACGTTLYIVDHCNEVEDRPSGCRLHCVCIWR